MIAPDKKGVASCGSGADKYIPLGLSQLHQRANRSAEVKVRVVGARAEKIGRIWNGQGMNVPQNRIVFTDNNRRRRILDRLPDPVIVPVNVNAQQADLTLESGFGNQAVDVIPVDFLPTRSHPTNH